MAYGGGGSATGSLGLKDDDVSPPIALGVGETFHDIADAATSNTHTLLVRRNGSVWSLGGAAPRQLTSLVDINRVATGGSISFAIDTGGVMWEWTQANPTPTVSALSDVISVDANSRFAVAARSDGALLTWDYTAGSTPVSVPTPADFYALDVAVGESIAVARSLYGEVIAWDPSVRDSVELIATGAKAIAAGDHHLVIASHDGTVQTRGANNHGQLGDGSFESSAALITVPGLAGVTDVAAGAAHSIAVLQNGAVFAWGSNNHRQLLAPTTSIDAPSPVEAKDVPRTARYAIAKDDITLLLNDPGTLAITHNIETYPFEFECGQPVSAFVSITGFDATGGNLGQVSPGLTDITMSINVAPEFVRTGSVTATAGTIATIGSQITWTLPSLGASTATMNLRLLPSGPEGEFPVFAPFSYVSAEHPAPFNARYPIAFHRECAPPPVEEEEDTEPPVISSVTPSISTLSPPNRHMVPVAINVTATDNESVPVCAVTGVTSNESLDPNDWAITGPLAVSLRAERAGQGSGRVYRIAVACRDEAGNSSTGSTTVTVPRGKKK
ncbi:MAG TPA: hypothetical protein VNT81_20260 [Vicinamibacterales bacterium]|nr:hypothetical protein [Vicinamibacterales bacterium]